MVCSLRALCDFETRFLDEPCQNLHRVHGNRRDRAPGVFHSTKLPQKERYGFHYAGLGFRLAVPRALDARLRLETCTSPSCQTCTPHEPHPSIALARVMRLSDIEEVGWAGYQSNQVRRRGFGDIKGGGGGTCSARRREVGCSGCRDARS